MARIPFPVVDSVENAAQVGGPVSENAVEAAAVFRVENLPAVRGADRIETVGVNQAAFEKIDRVEEFQLFRGEFFPAQPAQRQQLLVVNALIGQIVDGKKTAAAQKRLVSVDGFQENWQQPGLPVVAVKNFDFQFEQSDALGNCPAEKDESQTVVGVFATWRAVGIGAVEERCGGDEIVFNSGRFARLHVNGSRMFLCSEAELELGQFRRLPQPFELPVEGEKDQQPMAAGAKFPRQGSGDIGQPPGFDKGQGFGNGKKNIHTRRLQILASRRNLADSSGGVGLM